MTSARFIVGDVFDVLPTLPVASVDLVMTSPPFLALRSYLPADHPDKAREIGSEATPADYLDKLLDVVEACRRVLAPHGSLVFELGDTYSGSGGAGGDYGEDGLRRGARRGPGWPMQKSLTLIPQSFAWSLAYGRNPFTGRETECWRVRNVIAWCRPNPPVGALADKFRPATSYLTVATKARDRWFDVDAVRTSSGYDRRWGEKFLRREVPGQRRNCSDHTVNSAGAPLLDYWEIPIQPYKGSHYATFPEELPRRVILSMCPERVCLKCGEPSRRIVGPVEYVPSQTYRGGSLLKGAARVADGVNQWVGEGGASASLIRQAPTVGWTDCGHDNWRPGLVLDPFAGSGTTLRMALGNGRSSIGIDIDERNAGLARERVGPLYLEIEHPQVTV
jgi:site-specific DNA-methyltransferase (adenine-specific)